MEIFPNFFVVKHTIGHIIDGLIDVKQKENA